MQRSLLLLSLLLCLGSLQAQVEETRPKRAVLDYADFAEGYELDGIEYRRLVGKVEFHQDDIFIYCDSAIAFNAIVKAFGHVIFQQGDSVSVFADSAIYDSETQLSDLFGEVILQDGRQKLFTSSLQYDFNTSLGTYKDGAILQDGDLVLKSRKGYYYTGIKEVYFKDSVSVTHPKFQLRSDSMQFHMFERKARFYSPTVIRTSQGKIYAERGFFDTDTEDALFYRNAQFVNDTTRAQADSIVYFGRDQELRLVGQAEYRTDRREARGHFISRNDKTGETVLEGNAFYRDQERNVAGERIRLNDKSKSYAVSGRAMVNEKSRFLSADRIDYLDSLGMGLAEGRIVWQDTAQHVTILSDRAEYRKQSAYLKAYGESRPLLLNILDGDTLFLAADTFRSTEIIRDQKDTLRSFYAYKDVRMFKSDLQAVSDSLCYSVSDSLFTFYRDPFIWSDSTQFQADTIRIRMKRNQVDSIFLVQNALILNRAWKDHYNQIKGRTILAGFQKNRVDWLQVNGNAESIYYAEDDDKRFIGVNQSLCSEMRIWFDNNKIRKIAFYRDPKGKFIPIQDVLNKPPRLEGFRWKEESRPLSKADLFTPRQPLPLKR